MKITCERSLKFPLKDQSARFSEMNTQIFGILENTRFSPQVSMLKKSIRINPWNE